MAKVELDTTGNGAIDIEKGGTNATTAAGARAALGLGTAATQDSSAFESAGAVSTHAAATATHGATGAVVGTTNSQTLTNKTLTTPTIASFLNANHDHSDAAGGGGVSSVKKVISQASPTFSVGNVLYHTGTAYALAKADVAETAEVVGIVSVATSGGSFTLTISGYITGMSGLVSGDTYFLSATTAGALTNTAPTATGHINKPVLVADSTTSGWLINYRGIEIADTITEGHVVADEGTPLTQRGTLDFVGAGVTVTDGTTKTIVTIPGGGSGNLALPWVNHTADEASSEFLKMNLVDTSFTMPAGSGAPYDGAYIGFYNYSSSAITLTRNGTDIIHGNGSNVATTYSLGSYCVVVFAVSTSASPDAWTIIGEAKPTATGTLPTDATAGDFLYATGANTWDDTSGLSWDNTNTRLGLNTATPTGHIHIVGTAGISGSGNVSTTGSSTTVTSSAAFGNVDVGDEITANSTTRFVVAKASDSSLTVNTAVDWSTGYTWTYKKPLHKGLTESSNSFLVTATGWTAIGHGTPYAVLDVYYGIAATTARFRATNTSVDYNLLRSGTQPTSGQALFRLIGGSTDDDGVTQKSSGEIRIAASQNHVSGGNFGGYIAFLTANNTSTRTEKFRIKETGVLNIAVAPTDYADDTAAAAGGLAVGDIYRTGSILKIRVT